MGSRLQCDVCGAKTAYVADPKNMTTAERQMIAEFRTEHDATCAKFDRINYPGGAVSAGIPVPTCGPFGSEKPPTISTPRPHGHFERTGPYGELETGDTLSCCHCGAHWEVRAGSGIVRGFCSQCFDGQHGSGHTCGKPACGGHVPKERRLENIEAGRPVLTPEPAFAAVPKEILILGGERDGDEG